MLNTKNLEEYIKKEIKDKIPTLNLNRINFQPVTDNCKEGIYVFSDKDKYLFVFTERGSIKEKKELYKKEEVLWLILDELIFEEAMKYTMGNRRDGENFRKVLFDKEIELFSKFGNDFKYRRISEINEILRNNPYL